MIEIDCINYKKYSYYIYNMNKTLIYSCVFFNEKYIDLIYLLLKSYKLFGNSPDNIDYLIVTNPAFHTKIQNIFDTLNINGKIWDIDLKTKFDACCSRLKIFDYKDIDSYSKLLYLDSDILITNSINNILHFELENKIYAIKEGNTNHHFWGNNLFLNKKEKNPNISAFSSGILLFNNNSIIKELFLQIIVHINEELSIHKYEPLFKQTNDVNFWTLFGDQPFIVYNAIKNNLYNNKTLINLVVNGPNNFNKETISHFPDSVGKHYDKIERMSNFMNNIMFDINKDFTSYVFLFNKKYKWENSTIEFLNNCKMNAFSPGKYEFIDTQLVKCTFDSEIHLLKFNNDYSQFISVRKDDFKVIKGIEYKQIPQVIMQTSLNKPETYIVDIIYDLCPNWKYVHFIDREIIDYFKQNPISGFPNIIEKFNSFSTGQHKADLFRYYYLYLNGGIFLDSDAIFEVNIHDIIKSYNSVFVKSFMSNTHLFNGFIATYPKNPIIYDALKHAYETEDTILQNNYHYICEELWKIYHKHNFSNMKIYQEHKRNDGTSVILDDKDNKILTHYWQYKKIPFRDILNHYNS